MDTVRFNVCDGAKTFLIPVSIGDIVVQDSLAAIGVRLAWDKANLDLEDQVITSTGTLGSQFTDKMVTLDREHGSMWVDFGNTDLSHVVTGTGKPLFYVKGSVIAPDTVTGNNGWILVLAVHNIESSTRFDPIDISRPGLIQVERDTTAAYTGSMSVGVASFDTASLDTVTLTVGNLRNRRVSELEFSLKGDTRYFSFVDTIQQATIADSGIWALKNVTITPDSISGTLTAQSQLKTDGALIKLVLRRTTDSAFTSALEVQRFRINRQSCLGKLRTQGAAVTADSRTKDSSSGVVENRRLDRGEAVQVYLEPSGSSLRITNGGDDLHDVVIYDVRGELLERQETERLDASTHRVRLTTIPPSGIYFVGLRGRNEIVYKQFTIRK